MNRTICIYHGNCADGFTAAWAVRKALSDNVEFVPGVYGEAPPDVTGADVIMVDFSYKRPVIHEMARSARTILILDHHKTAQAELAGLPPPVGLGPTGPAPSDWGFTDVASGYHPGVMEDNARACNAPAALHAIFDMDRSGAQIAWDFFHPGQPRPKLVDYVADRDLWRFDLPRSREVAAWVFSTDYTFGKWSGLSARIEDDQEWPGIVAEGAAIERKHFKDIHELLKVTRREMVIGGHRVPVANLPYTMASDAAGAMAEDAPFAACYFDRSDARVFSLRSRREGGMDVAEIAASYGGGGHRNAAGFQAPIGWEGDDAF